MEARPRLGYKRVASTANSEDNDVEQDAQTFSSLHSGFHNDFELQGLDIGDTSGHDEHGFSIPRINFIPPAETRSRTPEHFPQYINTPTETANSIRGAYYDGSRSNSVASSFDLGNRQYEGHGVGTEPLRRGVQDQNARGLSSRGTIRNEAALESRLRISRTNHLYITLLMLSVFSFLGSGVYFFIAAISPRWGGLVHESKGFTYSSATLLSALFAKLIEISFVTVFVAFIGQVISKRAFMHNKHHGITLAEMSLRNWIMQPGSVFTHVEAVRYASFSLIGVLSLAATVTALLYTTAADALVSPQLRFSEIEYKTFSAPVKVSFANAPWIAQKCETPVTVDMDHEFAGYTCNTIADASQGYNNFERFLTAWAQTAANGNGSTNLLDRPVGKLFFNDNTTAATSWNIDVIDQAAASRSAGRNINNVSLAVPHAGIYAASVDPKNHIPEPEGTDGLNVFQLGASVPSPVLHVMCAQVEKDELAPLIYETFPNAKPILSGSSNDWTEEVPKFGNNEFLNRTKFDDIFGFGPNSPYKRIPPIFPKFPLPWNTIVNTSNGGYDRDSIYLLAAAPSPHNDTYNLCSMNVNLTPYCHSLLNSTSTGSQMDVVCEPGPSSNPLQYINSNREAAVKGSALDLNWKYVAAPWAFALSLNDGSINSNASIARLLTQTMTLQPGFDPKMPSLAESLAILGGNTLLLSSTQTPVVPFWNYTDAGPSNVLTNVTYQSFNGSFTSQQYTSGGTEDYQKGFYIILLMAFLGNLLVLVWLLVHRGLITDFSDTPNLFSLSINSPPTTIIYRTDGSGVKPAGPEYHKHWFVNADEDKVFFEHLEVEPAPPFREQLESLSKKGIAIIRGGGGRELRNPRAWFNR